MENKVLSCLVCEHERAGNCEYVEVEESSGQRGFMNVEYNILHDNSPHNCPQETMSDL